MLVHKAFKYQLKINKQQEKLLNNFAGCCRFVWNRALEIQIALLSDKQNIFKYGEMSFRLTEWKKEFPFLGECNAQILQQTLRDQDRALYDKFIKLRQFPHFKKKGKNDSFRFPQKVRFSENRVRLPKLGWFKFYKSREIEGVVKNVTVKREFNNWFIYVQTEMEIPEPTHQSITTVGIDLGIKNLAVLSDGSEIKSLNFDNLASKLAREESKLSRKVCGSSNWDKQVYKIRKIRGKIVNKRRDYLHKSTTIISKKHAVVVLEDLNVKKMTKSNKGTIDLPGKNVGFKSKLNKKILDQGWDYFKTYLHYKLNWLGGKLVLVPPQHTSQKCSNCQYIDKDNRKTQSSFVCLQCGYTANADYNASLNILAAGQAVLACA